MYLLKKVIQLREHSNPDHEKPFLEHLEDLRVMITRIVLTLLVSVLVCFTFQKKMMELLRKPVETVWMQQQLEKLPTKAKDKAPRLLTVERWEEAKKLEHSSLGLATDTRTLLFENHPDQDLVFHAKTVGVLRAAMGLPEEVRGEFLKEIDAPKEMKDQVKVLLEKAPSPEVDGRGNLRLMSALKPTETFMLSMKISFFSGIVVAFPLLLFFILQFILPGLHEHEKKIMAPALTIGFGLFLAGVAFAYFIVLPRALAFFYEWGGGLGVSNDWRIGEYISFATQFTLLFGVAFELPVLVMVLVRLGILTYETMSNTRAYAVLAIVVIAALLTPTPDAFTLGLMALPMVILYEICIWLAWFDRKKNRKREAEEARLNEERRALAMISTHDDSNTEPDHESDDHDDHDRDMDMHDHDEHWGMEHGDEGEHEDLEHEDFDGEPGLEEHPEVENTTSVDDSDISRDEGAEGHSPDHEPDIPKDRGPGESMSDDDPEPPSLDEKR